MEFISIRTKDKLFDAICLIIGLIMFYRGLMDFFLWGDDPYHKILGCAFFVGVVGINLMYRRLRLGFWMFVAGNVTVSVVFIFFLQDIWHHHVWPHILYALLFVPFLRDMRPLRMPRTGTGSMTDKDGNAEIIAELVKVNLDTADTTSGSSRRGQHPKQHGCVRAKFAVQDDIAEDVRSGIFKGRCEFAAVIRFSNGRTWDDRLADVHGMAIKLLNVPGPKLTEGHRNESAVDFVLADFETFFTGDLREYAAFTGGFLRMRKWPVITPFFWLWMWLSRPTLMRRVSRFTSRKPRSPLENSYFSTTPYRLGSLAVKYLVRPRLLEMQPGPVKDRNGLARALRDTLSVTKWTFDFGVDIQTDPGRQPVEDPTIPWSALPRARREWLATITIPVQQVSDNDKLGDDLAFSPWHTLEEHRPIGSINEARAPVYLKMATQRHLSNGVQPCGTSEIPARDLKAAEQENRAKIGSHE